MSESNDLKEKKRLTAYLPYLSRRDQWAALCGVTLLALYLIWFVVIAPSQQALKEQRLVTQAMQEQLFTVQQLAVKLQADREVGRQQPNLSKSKLLEEVNRSLQRHNLRLSGLQPGRDGELRLRLAPTAFNSVLSWLYQIDKESLVVVRDLSVQPASDKGQVIVSVRLAPRGSAGV